MDPDTNLYEQVQLAKKFVKQEQCGSSSVSMDDAVRLGELVIALNQWLQRGGVPPAVWHLERSKQRG